MSLAYKAALHARLAVILVAFFSVSRVEAQTVYNLQKTTGGGLGAKLAAVACNAAPGSRWTGWIQVDTFGRSTLDIDFVDADSDETSLDMRCETTRDSSIANDAGRDLPVIVSTASTGVNTLTQSTWRWVSTTGGAPGSSQYTITVSNIPAPFINCLFTCQGVVEAADTITVFARALTP